MERMHFALSEIDDWELYAKGLEAFVSKWLDQLRDEGPVPGWYLPPRIAAVFREMEAVQHAAFTRVARMRGEQITREIEEEQPREKD